MKKLLAAILALPVAFLSAPAKANTIQEHEYLVNVITKVGVPVIVNTRAHCSNQEMDGQYGDGIMIICQDNAKQLNGQSVLWTTNDLNTLRHEAHHLVQDCAAGKIADGKHILLFNEKKEYETFVIGSLGKETVELISSYYQKNGYDQIDILLELEAFAVAKTIDAVTIGNKILEFCTSS